MEYNARLLRVYRIHCIATGEAPSGMLAPTAKSKQGRNISSTGRSRPCPEQGRPGAASHFPVRAGPARLLCFHHEASTLLSQSSSSRRRSGCGRSRQLCPARDCIWPERTVALERPWARLWTTFALSVVRRAMASLCGGCSEVRRRFYRESLWWPMSSTNYMGSDSYL